MLRSSLPQDPDGHYARLGVERAATQAQIAKAFRIRARILHPDVPRTGNAEAFVSLKQAYDILSNPDRRAAYDRGVTQPDGVDHDAPADIPPRPRPAPPPLNIPLAPRLPRFSGVPVVVWAGMSAVLTLGLVQMTVHLRSSPKPPEAMPIRPNAPTVAPLSPSAQRAVLYGPPPVHLAGPTNFYVIQANEPAPLWRRGPGQNQLVRLGELPSFSTGHVVRLERQAGLAEILITGSANGFIALSRIAPGDDRVAHRAYCAFNAGPAPQDGELLEHRGGTNGTIAPGNLAPGNLVIENQAPQPAVVKLRDTAGNVMLSVYLGPGSQSRVTSVPTGPYRAEFAIGELWSRACNGFTAPVRTGQFAAMQQPGTARIVIAANDEGQAWKPMSEQDFEHE